MPPRCPTLQGTLTPFLYPVFFGTSARGSRTFFNTSKRLNEGATSNTDTLEESDADISHLNPPPSDYSRTIFSDKATVQLFAGSGGHGCISFLKEKYIPAGPANGGDGGSGGNIWIQAVRGETSLHKLSRRNILRAGRGKNGQGRTRGGVRGDDIIIQVPVGTVVREIERVDPVFEAEQRQKLEAGRAPPREGEEGSEEGANPAGPWKWDRSRWLLYPAITPQDIATAEFPRLPRARRPAIASVQVAAPVSLDLSVPMEKPLLLAAGAVGGLGNPHFVTKEVPRPKFATKGESGMSITLELELKLLADVGLVGLPNAGKSTLLRAMSKSRARVGNWAFTTLQPNIGTVVLDDYRGRPASHSKYADGEPRINYTIADIPGLVKDAHLDRGLGISFLRHVERARVLAFVVDLNAGDAVTALRALWKEVGEYERMKIQEEQEKSDPMVEWSPFRSVDEALRNQNETIVIQSGPNYNAPLTPEIPSIAAKPWFVVATKADLPGTQENFKALREYVEEVSGGHVEHPSGREKVWEGKVEALPISAINGHGTRQITELVVGLLDD